jgi:hypothetical protein
MTAGRLQRSLQIERDKRFPLHHEDGLAFETALFHSCGSLSRADTLAHGRGFIMTLDVMREAAAAVFANPEICKGSNALDALSHANAASQLAPESVTQGTSALPHEAAQPRSPSQGPRNART